MRATILFVAASAGLILLSGAGLWSPNSFASGTGEIDERRECEKVLQHYDDLRVMPARGNPDRPRYVECYYLLCGIMLDG